MHLGNNVLSINSDLQELRALAQERNVLRLSHWDLEDRNEELEESLDEVCKDRELLTKDVQKYQKMAEYLTGRVNNLIKGNNAAWESFDRKSEEAAYFLSITASYKVRAEQADKTVAELRKDVEARDQAIRHLNAELEGARRTSFSRAA